MDIEKKNREKLSLAIHTGYESSNSCRKNTKPADVG